MVDRVHVAQRRAHSISAPARKRSLRAVAALAALIGLAHGADAQELRGTWIARDGLDSRAHIESALDALVAAHFNVVCVDVWSRGYPIYRSDVMLRTAGVAQDPGYVGRDPLAEVVFEAHRRGLEVEAWFEYGFCTGWSGYFAGSQGRGPVLDAHPTWAALDGSGNSRVSDGAGGFFSWVAHENPEARTFLLDLVGELVERYDVDGVQLDRVRYPSTAFGYDAATIAAWRATHNNTPPPANPEDAAWKRFRADGLNAFVQQAWTRIKERRGTVRCTAAPVVWPTSYDLYLQDWPAWVRAGALDLVYPQVYRYDVAAYTQTLDLNLAQVGGGNRQRVVPGVRAISGTPTNEVLAMIAVNRARGLSGEVLWYMEGIYDDLPALASGPYASPAMVPSRGVGYRALPAVREENDASTLLSPGWTAVAASSASGGRAAVAAAPGASAEFRYTPAASGLYTVLAHQPGIAGGGGAVAHRLLHAGGNLVARRDQTAAGGRGWRELGLVWLNAGVPASVRVESDGSGAVADAAMWMVSRLCGGPTVTFGAPSGGAAVPAEVSLSGAPAIGSELSLHGNSLPALAPLVWVLGATRVQVPVFGGTLLAEPAATFVAGADARGESSWSLRVPRASGLRGARLVLQTVAVDASASQALSFSRGVETTVW